MSLAAVYQTEDAQRGATLSAMIDRQEIRAKVYPVTRKQAQALAKECATAARESQEDTGALHAMCDRWRIEYPASDYGRHCEVARLTDAGWWARKIRPADWRQYETQQLRLGNVTQYVSDEIAKARQWHRAAIRQQLENLFLIRDDHQAIITMAQASDAGTANPAIRRAEMIVRAKGLARWRAAQGFTWTFVTITAPSKYHRMRTVNGKQVQNGKWDGATPRETQKYLCAVWARIRAALQRSAVEWSCFRTVEPHADGTPHWHLCLFVLPENLPAVRAIFRKHALAEDGTEPGADLHRCTFEDYAGPADDAAAVADRCIAYLIAYVSKNIDGDRVSGGSARDTDNEGQRIDIGAATESAARVEAWATLWGIRQFAELGGSQAVTAYRELRRLREAVPDSDVEAVRAPADGADYCAFIEQARQRDLELWTQTTRQRLIVEAAHLDINGREASPALAELATEKNLFNKYGEPVRRWIFGIVADGKRWLTREHAWTCTDAAGVERIAADKAAAAYFRKVGETMAADRLHWPDAVDSLLALAPGFLFLRAPPARALDS